MISRVDSEWFSTTLLEAIIDYEKDDSAIEIDDEHAIHSKSRKRLWKTTQGLKLKVIYTDDVETWMQLKDLKESNTVKVTEFSMDRVITSTPVFCLWVTCVPRKSNIEISNSKYAVQRIVYKHITGVPTYVEHTKMLGADNGNNVWLKIIGKDMHAAGITFEILEENEELTEWHKK